MSNQFTYNFGLAGQQYLNIYLYMKNTYYLNMQMKAIIYLVLCVLLVPAVTSCAQRPLRYEVDPALRALLDNPPVYPPVNFVVMTDLHIYDPHLGTDGKAFESYVEGDYKLIKESAISNSFVGFRCKSKRDLAK